MNLIKQVYFLQVKFLSNMVDWIHIRSKKNQIFLNLITLKNIHQLLVGLLYCLGNKEQPINISCAFIFSCNNSFIIEINLHVIVVGTYSSVGSCQLIYQREHIQKKAKEGDPIFQISLLKEKNWKGQKILICISGSFQQIASTINKITFSIKSTYYSTGNIFSIVLLTSIQIFT